MRQRSKNTRFGRMLHGFTLVELIVVISIIALLLSILLPSLGKAKQTAIRIECSTRLRELARFNFMYADANGGRIPPLFRRDTASQKNQTWSSFLTTQITSNSNLTTGNHSMFVYRGMQGTPEAIRQGHKSALSCPASVRIASRKAKGLITPSYARNQHLYKGNWWFDTLVLSTCRKPSATIFFADAYLQFYSTYVCAYAFTSPLYVWYYGASDRVTHGRYLNFAWVDGHVSSERPEDYDSFVPIAQEWVYVE